MPAPLQPGEDRGRYDRWTFDRWSAHRAQVRQRIRRRIAVAACTGVVLLGGLGWLGERQRRASPSAVPMTSAAAPKTLLGVTVILDPGHGGEDPGASLHWGRQKVQEAALTYRTAQEFARILRARGADVRYTVRSRMLDDGEEALDPAPILPVDAVLASTDRPLRARVGRSPRQLWQRADLARQIWESASRTDPQAARDVFFLSLHYDESHSRDIRGGLVCIDRRAGPPPAFGVALARTLTARGWGRPEIADGQAGLSADTLGVLNPAFNPVPQKALLEVATLSNLGDYLCATDPLWRAQVAESVAQAISQVHSGR